MYQQTEQVLLCARSKNNLSRSCPLRKTPHLRSRKPIIGGPSHQSSGERHLFGKPTEYLCNWESDPQTGAEFPPSWEPKKHLTKALLDEWELEKLQREGDLHDRFRNAQQPLQGQVQDSDSSRHTPVDSTRKSLNNRRQNNVIEDSSSPAPSLPRRPSLTDSLANQHDSLTNSNPYINAEAEPIASTAGNLIVLVSQRDNFDRDEFLSESQLPASSPGDQPLSTKYSTQDQRGLAVTPRLFIPDSQNQETGSIVDSSQPQDTLLPSSPDNVSGHLRLSTPGQMFC